MPFGNVSNKKLDIIRSRVECPEAKRVAETAEKFDLQDRHPLLRRGEHLVKPASQHIYMSSGVCHYEMP